MFELSMFVAKAFPTRFPLSVWCDRGCQTRNVPIARRQRWQMHSCARSASIVPIRVAYRGDDKRNHRVTSLTRAAPRGKWTRARDGSLRRVVRLSSGQCPTPGGRALEPHYGDNRNLDPRGSFATRRDQRTSICSPSCLPVGATEKMPCARAEAHGSDERRTSRDPCGVRRTRFPADPDCSGRRAR